MYIYIYIYIDLVSYIYIEREREICIFQYRGPAHCWGTSKSSDVLQLAAALGMLKCVVCRGVVGNISITLLS